MSTVLSTVAEYTHANPRSQAAYERALRLFPSGLTHDARRQSPFPPCVMRAEGAHKWDLDGHRIIDYVTGHGALVAGHSHPAVVEAVRRQAGLGMHLGASSELEAGWAERIVALVPSAERVRFTSSGTEATLLALRVARGFTGRDRVLKLSGHFHGWHGDAIPGVALPVDPAAPVGSPPNPDLTVVDPFAAGALESELARGDVACVILEPTGAAWGAVPLPPERVAEIAGAARAHGTLVVFDEIVTGFRWSPGGAQAVIGVTPDLTALAKIMAGGLPGGALTGRAEVMEALAFREGHGKVEHPGTHNGHPLAAVAGTATLDLLADGSGLARADAVAAELRTALCGAFERRSTPGFAYGQSSTFCLIFGERTDDPVTLKRGVPEPLLSPLQCAMLLEGVHLFHGSGLLSLAHGPAEAEDTAAAFTRALERLQDEGLIP
ncbi:MAG TPA: aminotransferase class III-fold pyridoxal phosphate-dependent enzyme [Gaiellales bacterium]|jgi:glutamate-1-semialdehyde 2,1-aminomutase|nr:aminotransferase class III-fold pyridoxal phosphate-dependent enzyme [Gaiellales bacterium]